MRRPPGASLALGQGVELRLHGFEQLLLGVSASGVNKLHQLSEPIQVAAHEHTAPANMFSKLLAHHRESQQ